MSVAQDRTGDPEAGDRGIGHTSKGAPRPRRIDRRSWRLYLPGHGHALGVACQVVGVVANREARVDRRGVGLVEADHSDEQLAALTWRDAPGCNEVTELGVATPYSTSNVALGIPPNAWIATDGKPLEPKLAVNVWVAEVVGLAQYQSWPAALVARPVRSTASRHFRRRCRRTSGCRQRMRRPLPR